MEIIEEVASLPSRLVTVGIVCWNNAHQLRACLKSVVIQDYPSIEVVMVDNNSSDGSPTIFRSIFPDSSVIINPANLGFSRGHNQAITSSRGELYLALNPDVRLDPDYISLLVKVFETKPYIGIAGGKLLRTRDPQMAVIDTTGLFIDRARRQYLRGHGENDLGQYDESGEVFGIDGAAPIYRRTMLEEIKYRDEYFDESFFIHKEDVDLAWRARLLGWKAWYDSRAVAIHPRHFRPGERAGMTPEIRKHAIKNRYLLMLKNEIPRTFLRDLPRILYYDLRIFVYLLLYERSSLGAIKELIGLLRDARSWRSFIRSRTKSTSSEILSWFG